MSTPDRTLKAVEKAHGKGALVRLGDKMTVECNVIPTGSLNLDIALGVGGYPRGRITEIYGPESSGKTTLALHAAAETQKAGGNVCFIDAEHALDPAYAEAIGADVDNFYVSQPDSGEDGLTIAKEVAEGGEFDLIIVDSVAALTPRAELAGEIGDSHVGLQARLMSQSLRIITGTLQRTDTACIFINQLREKIGIMFGSPETTPGGRALKFYSSVRLDIRRVGSRKDGVEIVGNETRVKVVKNKMAAPFRQAEFDIMYGQGIRRNGEVIDLACTYDIIKKSGAWYYDEDGVQLAQGRDNAIEALDNDPEHAEKLSGLVLAAVHGE